MMTSFTRCRILATGAALAIIALQACAPKARSGKIDQFGCNEPPPDVFTTAGIDVKFAQTQFMKLATGEMNIKSDPKVISLASQGVIDGRIIEYIRCLAIQRDKFTLEQAVYLESMYLFMKTQPTPEQFQQWQDKNPFPKNTGTKDDVKLPPHADLQKVIDAAEPNSVINLSEGNYHLSLPLTINKPLQMIGVSRDKTIIISDADQYVMRIIGPLTFFAKEITFEHRGSKAADVLLIESSEVTITDCRFSGGIFDQKQPHGGNGLVFVGSAKGTVNQCWFSDNMGAGIVVGDRSHPTLEYNQISKCNMGIVYRNSTRGIARNNELFGIQNSGFIVVDQAQPTIESNKIQTNGENGVGFFGFAGGLMQRNEVFGNLKNGVFITGDASPSIEDNQISQNQSNGIYVTERARPKMERNIITNNGDCGIKESSIYSRGVIGNSNNISGHRTNHCFGK